MAPGEDSMSISPEAGGFMTLRVSGMKTVMAIVGRVVGLGLLTTTGISSCAAQCAQKRRAYSGPGSQARLVRVMSCSWEKDEV